MNLRRTTVPIFIIVRDRLVVLREAIASYRACIGTPFELVFHDSGSTFPETVEFLKEAEREGRTVYRCNPFGGNDRVLNSVRRSIADFLGKRRCPYYVVTDPDVALDHSGGDVLECFAFLLGKFGVPVAGPMLRIDDIPDWYPLKSPVVVRNRKQYWNKKPSEVTYKGRPLKFQFAGIETTFGMYPGAYRFNRRTSGIRTYAPYTARHLDWYLDPRNLSPDQVHYARNALPKISHWSKIVR